MIKAVNIKIFEQFISNFTNMMIQVNGGENIAGRPNKAKPVKVTSLVGSVNFSELKKIFHKKQNQIERNLKSLNYN